MARKPKKEKKSKGIWKLYELAGGLKRKNKSCPKCGSGTFMAQHKDRYTCGKCQYSEFISKKSEGEKPEGKPAEKTDEVDKEENKQ